MLRPSFIPDCSDPEFARRRRSFRAFHHREHGTAALENFTEPKAVWMNLNV